jgi:hypothetical protein
MRGNMNVKNLWFALIVISDGLLKYIINLLLLLCY